MASAAGKRRDQPQPAAFLEHREKQAAEQRKLRRGAWSWLGNCGTSCRLNPENTKSLHEVVNRLFEEGEPDRIISMRLRDMNYDVSHAAVQRHRVNHLYKADWHTKSQTRAMPVRPQPAPEPTNIEELDEVDNVQALRRIISLGMQRLPQSKITADLVVKAIDLEERLTRGNKTNALLEAIQGAFDEEEDEDEVVSPMDAAAVMAAGSDEHSGD